ncbi:MAG: sugar transferase [Actinomycetota bacterium]|nr:sugar transferase [Actinomycetota bacterium]
MTTVSASPPIRDEASIRHPALVVGRRRPATQSWRRKALLTDVTSAGLAVTLTVALSGWRSPPLLPVTWMLALLLLVPIIAALRGAYSWRMHLDVIDGVWTPFLEVGIAGLLVSFAWAMFSLETYRPRLLLVTYGMVAFGVALARATLYFRETASRQRGESLRPTLIVGAGRVGRLVARRLLQHPEFGLLPLGHLDDDPPALPEQHALLPILGGTTEFEDAVARYGIDQIVITFSRASHEELLSVAERAAALRLDVALIPRLYEKTGRRLSVGHVGGLPLLDLRVVDTHGSYYFPIKHLLDRVVAALVLVLMSPVFAIAIAAVRFTMGRPIFFRQIRVGRNEEQFLMLKLRTMSLGYDGVAALAPDTAPGGVEGNVDRRTRLGRFLRRSSLDELPQLLNVLKGEMSLIGPRPERPEFVRAFCANVDGYSRRHRVKAGITGWAQVNGLRGQTSISDRAEWDNHYIDNLSPSLDLKILLLTFAGLLRGLRWSREQEGYARARAEADAPAAHYPDPAPATNPPSSWPTSTWLNEVAQERRS